jgi:hypothetical protein
LIRNVSLFLAIALLASFASAGAQQTPPPTFLDKQLSRIDLYVGADGLFNHTVSGPVEPKGTAADIGQTESDQVSNTVGELATIRYVARPYVGFELNFVNARYTENYCCTVTTAGGVFGVQTGAHEWTLGYVVTPRTKILGFQPFISVGGGATDFIPTAHGGEGLGSFKQARATYYYSFGLQDDLSPHFGLRAGFREAFYLAPDYGQNYLTILQHTYTYEPNAGFYLRF